MFSQQFSRQGRDGGTGPCPVGLSCRDKQKRCRTVFCLSHTAYIKHKSHAEKSETALENRAGIRYNRDWYSISYCVGGSGSRTGAWGMLWTLAPCLYLSPPYYTTTAGELQAVFRPVSTENIFHNQSAAAGVSEYSGCRTFRQKISAFSDLPLHFRGECHKIRKTRGNFCGKSAKLFRDIFGH